MPKTCALCSVEFITDNTLPSDGRKAFCSHVHYRRYLHLNDDNELTRMSATLDAIRERLSTAAAEAVEEGILPASHVSRLLRLRAQEGVMLCALEEFLAPARGRSPRKEAI